MATKASKKEIKTESFSELYDRACTLKRQEKQISARAAIRGDTRAPTEKPKTNYLMSLIDIQQSKIIVRDAPQVVSSIRNSKPKPKVQFQTHRPPVQSGNPQHNKGCWFCGSLPLLNIHCQKLQQTHGQIRSIRKIRKSVQNSS